MNEVQETKGIHKVARSLYEIVELIAFTVLAVLLIMTFVCRHSVVVGSSMDNTLSGNQHLLISDLFYTPKQGDIVVFDDLSIDDHTLGSSSPLIKRVIAVEGQTVKITKDKVYVDGQLLTEDYVYFSANRNYNEIEEFVIPEGCLFVMGDHRNVSYDSEDFGVIDERAIVGKVILRLRPFTIF